jgi:hypothetical protein
MKMSFLKSLFGGGKSSGSAKTEAPLGEENYRGYLIRAIAMQAGSEFQLAGTIEKEIDGEVKVHRFVRADRLPNRDEAASISLSKGRQLVDEQGDKLFS